MKEKGKKVISKNRRATFDYALGERFEAGMVLRGTEIKALRSHGSDLKRSYARIDEDGEVWLLDAYIVPYEMGNRENHEPERPRKLLLHRREIAKLERTLQEVGVTLVPTIMYFVDGRAKVEIAVARGKKKHDKRQDIAKRDAKRQTERALRQRY